MNFCAFYSIKCDDSSSGEQRNDSYVATYGLARCHSVIRCEMYHICVALAGVSACRHGVAMVPFASAQGSGLD